MNTNSMTGRLIAISAALAMASPVMATPAALTAPAVEHQLVEAEAVPGLDIPEEEADQLQGGKLKAVVIIFDKAKGVIYRTYTCASSAACRDAVKREFGKTVKYEIFLEAGKHSASWVACRAGWKRFC